MARKLLHLLLVTAIVVCPIGCRPGLCALADGCSVPRDSFAGCEHPCDEEGPHEHPGHHPLPPCSHSSCDHNSVDEQGAYEHLEHHPFPPTDRAPCDHNPCEGRCQCICGGAILSSSAELDFELLLIPAPDSMAAWCGIHDSLATHGLGPEQTAPDDDDGALSGRAIRCLHSSLLC